MAERDRLRIRHRRKFTCQRLEGVICKRRRERTQPVGPFRVTLWRDVVEAGLVVGNE
jgi:hypothetical protein